MNPIELVGRVSLAGACLVVEGVVWLADVLEERRQRTRPAPVGPRECVEGRDWTVRPGSTLKEWREENGLPLKPAATACRMEPELFARIEAGQAEIDPLIASQLQVGTGIPARLWLNLERAYREDLAAGRKDFDA